MPAHRPCSSPRLSALSLALALAAQVAPTATQADTFTWTGSASGQWSNAANWAEGALVGGATTQLLINTSPQANSFNDIAAGLVLNRLTLGPAAGPMTISGQALIFQGTAATLAMQSTGGHSVIQNNVQLGSDLSVDGGPAFASQLFLQGAISGAGALRLASGVTVMSGSNSYTGLTTVASGAVLGVSGLATASSAGLVIASGAELQLLRSGGNTFARVSAPIQLGGVLSSFAKKRPDFLGFPVASAFVSGPINLTADARIVAFGATGSGLNSTELVVGGSIGRSGQALTLVTGGANNTLRVSNTITGNGDLLLRANGGGLFVGGVAGDGAILVAGTGGNLSLGAISGAGLLDVSASAVEVVGAISGARDLRVTGGSLLLAEAAHSFSGSITLQGAGSLSVGREGLLGDAANSLRFVAGGTLHLTGQEQTALGSLTRAISTTGGTAMIDPGAGTVRSVSSTISGDGGLGFFNFGLRTALTLSGANSFAGGLTIGSNVSVAFNDDGNLGAAGGRILLGGSLVLPVGYTLDRPLELSGNDAGLAPLGPAHLISSTITGDGLLRLGGAATFTLTGNNTHAGGVALAGQSSGEPTVLVIGSDARLGAVGGVLDIGRQNGFFVLPGKLVAAADLSIAASRSTSFRAMTVDSNGFDVTFNQAISGRGMTKTGAGTWRLNTANTDGSNVNEVQVVQGTLQLGIDEALGTRAAVAVAGGGTLDLAGRTLTPTDISVAEGGVVTLGQGGTLRTRIGEFNGGITGSGSVVLGLSGFTPGDTRFNAANSFSGSVSVLHGSRLVLNHALALGLGGSSGGISLLLDKGTLAAGNQLAGPVVISAATPLTIGAGGAGFAADGQSLIIERQLTGNSPLAFFRGSRPGESTPYDVRLANAANNFVGHIQLGDPASFGPAILGITADGALGNAANTVTLGGRFFDGESNRSAFGGLRSWAHLSLAASRVLQLDGNAGETNGWIDSNGFTFVVQGGIGELASGMSLLKTGSGTLVLNGINSYSGETRVDDGTLGGHGEVASALIGSSAALAPGESVGLFSIRNDLRFDGGHLLMELGGLTRGLTFDALNIGGSVDLGGSAVLQLNFTNGFAGLVQTGDSFQLLQAGGGIFGQFANVVDGGRLLTADGAGSFVVHYGDGQQGLLLSDFTAAAVPEPSTYALLLGGLLAIGLARRRMSC